MNLLASPNLRVLLVVLLLSLNHFGFSQIKEVKGDTSYWYNRNKDFIKNKGLKDFEKTTDDFNFRFRNHGQVIEISKDGPNYSGTITNYIYHTKKAGRNRSEMLSDKVILSSNQVEDLLKIIQRTGILQLPSSNEIKAWKNGFDGISYMIEQADRDSYWMKNYWTPTSQDSIPESLVVLDFINALSDYLHLPEVYSSFRKTLPKRGCYNTGSMSNVCYISNTLLLGYEGTDTKPLGIYVGYTATYIGNAKINAGASLKYLTNNAGYDQWNLQLSKWNILFGKSSHEDFLVYNFNNREEKKGKRKEQFQNHQVKYGMHFRKNFSAGIGVDHFLGDQVLTGLNLYGYKWFSLPKISTTVITSIFKNQVNYEVEVSKSFWFKNRNWIRSISFGLGYGSFMGYQNWNYRAQISI